MNYASGLERRVAELLLIKGVPFEYEQWSYLYTLPVHRAECSDCGSKAVAQSHWYTPDFFLDNGVVLEVKGYFKAKDRKIALAMLDQHPEVDLRLVFGNNNKLHRNSDTRYSDWCTKYGVPFVLRLDIPDSWLVM